MEFQRAASGAAWSRVLMNHSRSAFLNKIKKTAVNLLIKFKVVRRNKSLPQKLVAITGSPANASSPPCSANLPNCQQTETMQPPPPRFSVPIKPKIPADHIVVDIDLSTDHSPFIENYQKQELGKTLFTISVPIITGLMLFHGEKSTPVVYFTIIDLSAGCTAIFNGLLLRKTYPRIASFAEQFGICVVLLGFYVQVGTYLPQQFRFAPVVFYTVCLMPFAIGAIKQLGDINNNDHGTVDTQGISEVAENTSFVAVTECLAQAEV